MKAVNSKVAVAIRVALMTAPGLTLIHAEDKAVLEEVLVYGQAETYRPDDQTTATGLQMKLIETPQSISVVSEAMMKQFNTRSAYDAADMIPGVSQAAQGFGLDHLLIRGQQVNEPRVNGVNASTAQFLDSFALERIEFVRGPATVLYGVTGAFGGELNQILKRPESEFQAEFGFRSGDYMRRRFEGDVTGAIPGTGDRLRVRLVGAYQNSGIPQETAVPANNISRLASAAATYDFTDTTRASVYAYAENRHFDPTDGCPMGLDANNRLYIPTSIPVEHWYCNDSHNSKSTLDNQFIVGTLSHKFANDWSGDARIAHSTRIRTSDYVFGFGPAGAFGLPDTDIYLYSYKDRDDQNALTANLSLGGKLDLFERTHQFLVALEYQHQHNNRPHYTSGGIGTMNMFQDGGEDLLSDGSPMPVIPEPTFLGSRDSVNKVLRGSLQALINATDRVQILGGVLVQKSDLVVQNLRVTPPSTRAALNETDTVGRFAISYKLVQQKTGKLTDARTYFNYSEGFQPNVGVFDVDGNALTDPQRMKSYEVGLKSQWFDGNVEASIAAYHSYVTNVPKANWNGVGSTGGFFSSVLGGKSTYDGVDVEVLGEVLPGWNLDVNYAYIKTRIESVVLDRDLYVASVPRQQIGLLSSYEFLTGSLKGLIVGASVVRKIDVPTVDNDSAFFSGNYDPANQLFNNVTKVDFRASYKGFTGRLKGLELSANIYNAFNARSYYSLSQTPAFSNTVGQPRTVSVGVRYTFGR